MLWTLNLKMTDNTQRDDFNNDIRLDFTGATNSPYVKAASTTTKYADFLVDTAAAPNIGTAAGYLGTYWLAPTVIPVLHMKDAGYQIEADLTRVGLSLGITSKVENATITMGMDGVSATIQLTDARGTPALGRHQVTLAIYGDADGAAYIPAITGPTNIATAARGTLLRVDVGVDAINKVFIATTDKNGFIDLTWTDGATAGYLGVILPNSRLVISPTAM